MPPDRPCRNAEAPFRTQAVGPGVFANRGRGTRPFAAWTALARITRRRPERLGQTGAAQGRRPPRVPLLLAFAGTPSGGSRRAKVQVAGNGHAPILRGPSPEGQNRPRKVSVALRGSPYQLPPVGVPSAE